MCSGEIKTVNMLKKYENISDLSALAICGNSTMIIDCRSTALELQTFDSD